MSFTSTSKFTFLIVSSLALVVFVGAVQKRCVYACIGIDQPPNPPLTLATQKYLIAAGEKYAKLLGKADGIFGYNTDRAVRQFQKDNGCKVDGIVGACTATALSNIFKKPLSEEGGDGGLVAQRQELVDQINNDLRPLLGGSNRPVGMVELAPKPGGDPDQANLLAASRLRVSDQEIKEYPTNTLIDAYNELRNDNRPLATIFRNRIREELSGRPDGHGGTDARYLDEISSKTTIVPTTVTKDELIQRFNNTTDLEERMGLFQQIQDKTGSTGIVVNDLQTARQADAEFPIERLNRLTTPELQASLKNLEAIPTTELTPNEAEALERVRALLGERVQREQLEYPGISRKEVEELKLDFAGEPYEVVATELWSLENPSPGLKKLYQDILEGKLSAEQTSPLVGRLEALNAQLREFDLDSPDRGGLVAQKLAIEKILSQRDRSGDNIASEYINKSGGSTPFERSGQVGPGLQTDEEIRLDYLNNRIAELQSEDCGIMCKITSAMKGESLGGLISERDELSQSALYTVTKGDLGDAPKYSLFGSPADPGVAGQNVTNIPKIGGIPDQNDWVNDNKVLDPERLAKASPALLEELRKRNEQIVSDYADCYFFCGDKQLKSEVAEKNIARIDDVLSIRSRESSAVAGPATLETGTGPVNTADLNTMSTGDLLRYRDRLLNSTGEKEITVEMGERLELATGILEKRGVDLSVYPSELINKSDPAPGAGGVASPDPSGVPPGNLRFDTPEFNGPDSSLPPLSGPLPLVATNYYDYYEKTPYIKQAGDFLTEYFTGKVSGIENMSIPELRLALLEQEQKRAQICWFVCPDIDKNEAAIKSELRKKEFEEKFGQGDEFQGSFDNTPGQATAILRAEQAKMISDMKEAEERAAKFLNPEPVADPGNGGTIEEVDKYSSKDGYKCSKKTGECKALQKDVNVEKRCVEGGKCVEVATDQKEDAGDTAGQQEVVPPGAEKPSDPDEVYAKGSAVVMVSKQTDDSVRPCGITPMKCTALLVDKACKSKNCSDPDKNRVAPVPSVK